MTEAPETGRDDELERLLPWYVNGTLDDAERAAVEAYLERSPDARQEVSYLHALHRQAQAMPMPESPGEFGLARVLRDIDRAGGGAAAPAGLRGRPRVWQALAIAACLALVIETGVLVSGWFEDAGTVRLAGGPGAEAGRVVQVTFRADATEAGIRGLLLELDATIVGGPSALGVYRLRLGAAGGDAAERAVAALAARSDLVESVAEE